ncbi:voltage-dependent T-type calcium channel subunit alpha-1H-like [Xenia sp. Carnegie-2017]|uniref:voltage-dependent T-type calcium channel subunit alpha-1H-like n=1 Tax=Xenia sp. Carnegie-2017 TaxID=2897299 RepID=UPI001F049532|nr:voltage-dependent T-type calcium channel subunit alpha-1H-like [Xenia sp. Carnegie-2017]
MYNPFDKTCATKKCQILEILETAIYAFFVVEMLIKWMAMGFFGDLGYFKDSWNKLDCFIVLAGTFELAYGEGKYLSAVRSVRVLRPLRAINRVPSKL